MAMSYIHGNNQRLDEGPDRAVGLNGRVLNFGSPDARAFGGLMGRIAVANPGIYHGKIITIAGEAASKAKPVFFGSNIDAAKFYTLIRKLGILLEAGMTAPEITKLMESIQTQRPDKSADASRKFLMVPLCGRIWTDGKLVSFWNKQESVTPSSIERLMNVIELDPQDFRYQFIEHDKTAYEDLPNWSEASGKTSANQDQIAKRFQMTPKEIRDLQAKAHVSQATMTDRERMILTALRGKQTAPSKPSWNWRSFQTSESFRDYVDKTEWE